MRISTDRIYKWNISYNVRLGTRRQINDYVKYVRGYQQNVPQHYYFLDILVLGGYSRKNWVGGYGPLSKTLTLYKNKICDFFFPIYDITKNSIHLFKTWHLNQYPVSDLISSLIYTVIITASKYIVHTRLHTVFSTPIKSNVLLKLTSWHKGSYILNFIMRGQM